MNQIATPTSTIILEDRIKLLLALKAAKNDLKFGLQEADRLFITIQQDKQNHMLSLSQDVFGKVSFAKTPEDVFNSDKRVRIEFSKYVRTKLEIPQKEITDFLLNKLEESMIKYLTVQSPEELEKKIKILSGEELVAFLCKKKGAKDYNHGNSKEEHLNLFAINPDKIKLATFDETCYALIWYCDNSVRVMDYVYPYGDWMERSLFLWAKNNGIITRTEAQKFDLEITLKNSNVIPILDTFFCGQRSSDGLTLRLNNNFSLI